MKSHGSERTAKAHFSTQSSGITCMHTCLNLRSHMQSTRCGHKASTILFNRLPRVLQAHYFHWNQQHGRPWQCPAGSTIPFQGKKLFTKSLFIRPWKQIELQELNCGAPPTFVLLLSSTQKYRVMGTFAEANQMQKWGVHILWYRSAPWKRNNCSNFEVPLRNWIIFWSAAEIIMRTTLIADDKSWSQWRIWGLQCCQGSSWRNKAAFCFCSKAFCLWFFFKNHFNAPLELVCNPITNLKMQLFWECGRCVSLCCMYRVAASCTENTTPCSVTFWSS